MHHTTDDRQETINSNKQRTTNETTTMKTSALENQMNKCASRSRATLTVIMAGLLFGTAALAQMPTSPWKKAAPFPEPDEELYGVACNGKMYVIGGWGDGKARGANYEYDPASDKWTKKKPMPLASGIVERSGQVVLRPAL